MTTKETSGWLYWDWNGLWGLTPCLHYDDGDVFDVSSSTSGVVKQYCTTFSSTQQWFNATIALCCCFCEHMSWSLFKYHVTYIFFWWRSCTFLDSLTLNWTEYIFYFTFKEAYYAIVMSFSNCETELKTSGTRFSNFSTIYYFLLYDSVMTTSHLQAAIEPAPRTSCISDMPQTMDIVQHNTNVMNQLLSQISENLVEHIVSYSTDHTWFLYNTRMIYFTHCHYLNSLDRYETPLVIIVFLVIALNWDNKIWNNCYWLVTPRAFQSVAF
jgi:hypothetical protein